MPVLKRHEIDPAIRAPHEKAYKAQLKKALAGPGLSVEEKEHLQEQLATVGKAKVYQKNSPSKPGALNLE